MATVSNWNPYGVYLNLTATSAGVTRISATQYTVKINVSWTSSGTWYWMKASSGGATKILYNGRGSSKGTSGTLTGTYSISENDSATKTITVTFTNADPDSDWKTYKTKTVSFNVTVPAWPSYTVKYNTNGGSGTFANQTKWKDKTLKLDTNKPTRQYYTFLGWATSSTATTATYAAGSNYTANAAVTLYAVWKANTYTISYNANGGTNAPSSQTKTYNVTLKLTTDRPVRIDYNFLGWATTEARADAGTIDYTSGETLGATSITSNNTLYAVWELAYVKPRINNFKLYRTAEAGSTNADDTGTVATFSFTYAIDSGRTLRSVVLSWSPAVGGEKQESLMSDNAVTTSGSVSVVKFSSETTYTFTLTIEDDKGSNSVTKTLSAANFPIDVKAGGTGIAFGKAAETDGLADFAYQAYFRSGIKYLDLPKGTNFNDVRNPGFYAGVKSDDTTYVNCPITSSSAITFTLEVLGMGGTGRVMQRLTTCHTTSPMVYERIFQGSVWGAWFGGWEDAALTSENFAPYNNETTNNPTYRKDGRMVEIRGAITPVTTIKGSTAYHNIFELKEGYRPSKIIHSLQQGSGAAVWLLRIDTYGKVDFARYRMNDAPSNAYSDAAPGIWLPFHVTYLV